MYAINLEEVTYLHARLCRALAEPVRLLLVYALAERPRTVNELAQVVGASQSATSRHLKTLRESGLVRASRQGPSVAYSLEDPRLLQALDLLRDILRDTLVRRTDLVKATPPPAPGEPAAA